MSSPIFASQLQWNDQLFFQTSNKIKRIFLLVKSQDQINTLRKSLTWKQHLNHIQPSYRTVPLGFRSQLIWICTVGHSECKLIATIWIKPSDWLTINSQCGILIYSAWQERQAKDFMRGVSNPFMPNELFYHNSLDLFTIEGMSGYL